MARAQPAARPRRAHAGSVASHILETLRTLNTPVGVHTIAARLADVANYDHVSVVLSQMAKDGRLVRHGVRLHYTYAVAP